MSDLIKTKVRQKTTTIFQKDCFMSTIFQQGKQEKFATNYE